MLALTFREQLVITLIDKAVIGGLLVLAAYAFNRSLEAFKGTQSRELAQFTLDHTMNLEGFKSRMAAEGESLRGVRLAVAEVAKCIAAANHSISWVCWKAAFTPANFTLDDVDKYDAEINSLLAEIASARVVLAALSQYVHEQLSPIVDKLYDLDVGMGQAKNLFRDHPAEGLQSFADIYNAARTLDDQLLRAVAELKWKQAASTAT